MRHRLKGKKLSRTASHRKATMQALAMALIRERRIVTTVTKAKALRGYIEPLITRAKEDSHHNRKEVFSSLQNKDAVTTLFEEIGPKCKDRPGGYTRVIKAGFRKGDGAETAIIELVDYNDIQPEGTKAASKKRTRRAGKSTSPATAKASKPEVEKGADTPSTEVMDEAPEQETQDSAETETETPAAEETDSEAETKNEVDSEEEDTAK